MTGENKALKAKLLKKRKNNKEIKNSIIYILIKICVLSLIIYLLLFQIFGIQIVNNEEMTPSFKAGSLTVYYRLDKQYTRYDVISATINNKINIYRIIGLPGDTIDITEDGNLLINGHTEEIEDYYKTGLDPDSKIEFPIEIKEDEVFILNDYRLATTDSRTFGPINKKDINGKIIAKLQIRDF